MPSAAIPLIVPDWPAPAPVRAVSSTRAGGVSVGPFASLNLGLHVGDEPAAVAHNRALLQAAAGLPGEPVWLTQVHGCGVCGLTDNPRPADPADAAVSHQPGQVCAVLTADCLPVLFCADDGSAVGAAHAGWRGLAAGVLEAAVAAMGVPPARLLAWLGPAIGPAAFEVGPEVRQAFVDHDPAAQAAFRAGTPGRWFADLWQLARQRLQALGLTRMYGGGLCTHADPERFFSHRRDGQTGRMATLIWLAPGPR